MNIFDILSFGERIIVHSDVECGILFTWNQSLTLQSWFKKDPDKDKWQEIDVRTLSDEPISFEEAKKKAHDWLYESYDLAISSD